MEEGVIVSGTWGQEEGEILRMGEGKSGRMEESKSG